MPDSNPAPASAVAIPLYESGFSVSQVLFKNYDKYPSISVFRPQNYGVSSSSTDINGVTVQATPSDILPLFPSFLPLASNSD